MASVPLTIIVGATFPRFSKFETSKFDRTPKKQKYLNSTILLLVPLMSSLDHNHGKIYSCRLVNNFCVCRKKSFKRETCKNLAEKLRKIKPHLLEQALGCGDHKRFAEFTMDLSSQQVEVVGRGRNIAHLPVTSLIRIQKLIKG